MVRLGLSTCVPTLIPSQFTLDFDFTIVELVSLYFFCPCLFLFFFYFQFAFLLLFSFDKNFYPFFFYNITYRLQSYRDAVESLLCLVSSERTRMSANFVSTTTMLRVDVSYFNKFDHVDIPRPCWRWPPAAALVFYYPVVSPPSAPFASRSRRPASRAAGRTTLLRVAREGYGMLIQPGNLG